MALISSIDITTRRIFLDNGVVALDDAVAFWREYRERRLNDDDDIRRSAPVMEIIGGQSKGGGTFVGRVVDLKGYKIVPQDTTHDLLITIEIIDSNLGISGRNVFDRTPLTPGVNVNIDIDIAPVEVITIATGSGVTEQDKTDIINGVWDEAIASHLTAGSTGEKLSDAGAAGSPPSAEEIADAVWDEAISGHVTIGTFGKLLADILNDTSSTIPALLSVIDGKINGIDAVVEIIEKLTGNDASVSGDIITIYESDGVTPWRQYDLANGGRILQ
jgi:hypothetical protein